MGIDYLTLSAAKGYTDESLLGGGAVVGKNVTISSITPIEGGNKVTFSYTLDNGTVKTSTMDVMDGIDGLPGKDGKDGLNGSDGIGISKIEKIGTVDLVDTYRITFTDNSTFDYEVKNGKDGQGGTGSGEENVIESIKVNGVAQTVADDKSVDITVPTVDVDKNYVDTELAKKANTSDIPSLDGYVTETELSAKGYLTEHQDISGKVDKVDGKSLIADTEIERLASVDNYNDAQIKTQIQAVANGLMDSVGYSADYKTIDIIAKNGVKKSIDVAPIISHASITELSDVDTTNKATGKALVYNATTSKHEYADVSGTDEKVKMDSSTDAKYLGELLDNITIANENGELKVKKLDGQEVTITEINYLKGLTMNVMDLVNMFSNGGVKIINTPVATYAELLTLDKSSFIEGVSYLVYVLADENHDNAKTTYLVDKDSETPTYFGFADSQRDFTTNPIDLATEITGKLGISNMDSDAIKTLFTVDDTYKTETATNNAFSTHGAKALYDELLLAIGNKANSSDLTAHKDDADIHVSTEDRTKWDSAKTHADSAHAPSNAQENVLETIKVNGTALEVSNKAVNVTVPTTVAELTDSSSYAKKTDIPTTLPANGGNSDTVNNHTVETDVPVDAVFTDTVYDDTEVKESIAELSSNLDGLEFGDVAGVKNLFDPSKILYGSYDYESNEYTFNNSTNKLFDLNFKENTQYTFSSKLKYMSGNVRMRIYYTDESYYDYFSSSSGMKYVSTKDKTIKGIYAYYGERGYITYSNFQIEEGTEATPYKPYIPSVKMIAEENAQQNTEAMDLKMLGWTVPKECPIQNYTDSDGVFHQRVGRVDLGSLEWNYATNPNRFNADFNSVKFVDTSTPIVAYSTKYDIYSFNTAIKKDKAIGVWGSNSIASFLVALDSSYTDATTFKNAMKGIYLYYELATPITKTIDGNEAVEELSSNLSQLEFGEVAGVRNLFDFGNKYGYKDESNLITIVSDKSLSMKTRGEGQTIIYRNKKLENLGETTISFSSTSTGGGNARLYFKLFDDNGNMLTSSNCNFPIGTYNEFYDGWYYDFSSFGDLSITFTMPTNVAFWNLGLGGGSMGGGHTVTFTNIQVEEGDTATPYEPYIPSVKMLAEEVNAQNESLSVIGKCKNMLNSTFDTYTSNGVTFTRNADETYTLVGSCTDTSSASYVSIIENLPLEIGKYKITGALDENNYIRCIIRVSGSANKNIYDYGKGVVLDISEANTTITLLIVSTDNKSETRIVKPMLTTDLNASFDDFVPYTGDGETLTHDVAEIKNDLSTKIYELAGSELYLCVSGKSCVLTLNGYNLTGSTNFSKLAEYPPYLVARNVVAKEDGVCIFSVDPDGNIGASDLQVASSVTGKMFGEVSWVVNI